MHTRSIFAAAVILLCSCAGKPKEDKKSDAPQPQTEILLDDAHSLKKNAGKQVPEYLIPSLDSFVVNVTDYNFLLDDPVFTYIGSGMNIPEMIGGDWVYVGITYNDSIIIRHVDVKEIEKDKRFAVTTLREKLKGNNPDHFTLNICYYADSGEFIFIDRFPVRVAAPKP